MDFVEKIRKIIKMRHDDVVVAMTLVGVDNMEKYQYMLGQIRTYQYLLQEISTLLKTKEQNDNKEQLSASNQKIILPNKKLVGVKKKEEKQIDESSKLPKPTGWRILVLPFKQKEKTKGGILLADETVERSQVASTCGLVLDMGPHCYDKERYPEGPWCKKGDWIIFARYAGSRIKIDGGEIRLLNDDEVLATVENPEDIFHEF